MRALKCDNCGGYYDYKSKEITKIAFCRPDGAVVKEKDICPECMAAVAKALDDVKMRKRVDPFEDDRK